MTFSQLNEYRRVLYSFLFIVLMTGSLLTVSLFFNFDRIASSLMQEYTVEELSQISQSTTMMFETSKSAILQYDTNPAVLQLMNYDNLDSFARADLLYRISGLIITMPYASSIYIYNGSAGYIYYNNLEFDSASFPDQNILHILDSGNVRKLYPFARSVPTATNFTDASHGSNGQQEDVYSFIYYDDAANRSIVLNVSTQWLKDTIQSMNSAAGREIVILDAQGNVVLGNKQYDYLSNVSKNTAFHGILGSRRPSGNLIRRIGGQKYLISYVSSDIFDWKYIRITPYASVQGKLSRVVVTTVLIAMLVIVLALLGARRFSRNVYAFFKRKIAVLSRQYAAEKSTGYDKRQDFLRRLLESGGDGERMASEFERYHIRPQADGSFRLVLFRIDRREEYNRVYSVEDRDLFAYGLVNIINELAEPISQHEAVAMGNGFFSLLLGMAPEAAPQAGEKLSAMIEAAQQRAEEYFGFSLSAVVGEPISDCANIPAGYAECRESMNYTLFVGHRAVIRADEVREICRTVCQIPVRQIDSLADNLLLGKQQEIRRIYDGIVESMKGNSFTALQMTMVQLGMSIKSELQKKNIFSSAGADTFFDMAERIPEMETIGRMKETYYQLFDDIIAEIHAWENNRRGQRDSLPDRVRRFVEQEYTDISLNSDMVARRFGISTDYLRRQYKKATGSSVAEFINSYRLRQACDRLQHTDDPVNEIASATGFVNTSYFYTAFKKAYDVTPGEFRSLKRDGK